MSSGPLYELVWHTETGLGVRYADSTLHADSTSPEKKAPLLWDTELFSITVSPPQHNGEGKSSKDEDLAEEKFEAVNSEPNPEIKNPVEVSSRQSNRRSHGQHSSSGANSRSTDSLLSSLQKLRPNIKEVEIKCAEVFGTSSNNNKEFVTSAKLGSPVNSESSPKRAACGCTNILYREEDQIVQCPFHQASTGYEGKESGVVAQSGEPGRETPTIGTLLNNHLFTPPTRKGKSAGTDTTGDGRRFSEVKANHDRAEESSANMSLSTRKRAHGFYTAKDFGGKKLKTKGNRSNTADSAHKQGNSFVNWISTMTSGLGFAHAASMLALIPQHSHTRQNNRTLLTSHGKDKGTFYSGLLSTSQTIYQPGSAVQDRIQGNFHHLAEDEFSRDFQDSRDEFGFGTHRIIYASTDSKLVDAFHEHKVSALPIVSHNQEYTTGKIHGKIPFEESPSITLTDNCIHQEKSEDSIGGNCSLPDIRSPNGFVPDDSTSTESRRADTRSFLPGRFESTVTDNTRSLKSLWITRLSPKVSAFISNQKTRNQGTGETKVTINMMTEAPFPYGLTSTMENIISGNLDSSSKVHRVGVSKELQNFSVYPSGSCIFKEKEVNQNHKSQRLQSTNVPNDASCAPTTCFFCGNSHGLGECSG